MSVLDNDSQNGRDSVRAFIEPLEANISRIYVDGEGIPTLGIGYALATRSGDTVTLRGRDELNMELQEAGILAEGQTLTDNDIEMLEQSVAAANGDINPATGAPFQNPIDGIENLSNDLNQTIAQNAHAAQGWSFDGPTHAENRELFDNIIDDFQTEAIGRLRTQTGGLSQEDADALYESLPEETQTTLISLAYNVPTTIGPGLSTALNDGELLDAWFEIRIRTNPQPEDEDGNLLPRNRGLDNRREIEAEGLDLTGVTEQEARDFILGNDIRMQIETYINQLEPSPRPIEDPNPTFQSIFDNLIEDVRLHNPVADNDNNNNDNNNNDNNNDNNNNNDNDTNNNDDDSSGGFVDDLVDSLGGFDVIFGDPDEPRDPFTDPFADPFDELFEFPPGINPFPNLGPNYCDANPGECGGDRTLEHVA